MMFGKSAFENFEPWSIGVILDFEDGRLEG
jgi:hypothetical protein